MHTTDGGRVARRRLRMPHPTLHHPTLHPSALLLGAQVLAIVAYPFLQDSRLGFTVLGVISMVAVGLAMAVVRSTPAFSLLAVAVGVPAIALTVAEAVAPESDAIAVASAVLHAVFYTYVTYSLICYLFHDDRVTTDEQWAIAATFTVLAWTFTYVYVVVAVLSPGAFQELGTEPADRFYDLLYLSFTVLTSVGLSDVLPVGDHARSVVILEQIAGVLYIAIVISRLVAMKVMRNR